MSLSIKTRPLTRSQISEFVSSPRGILAFEAAQDDLRTTNTALISASFLTLTSEPSLGSERIFTPASGQLVGADGGENAPYTLSLADTAVTPATYGSASKAVSFTVDSKGRITGAQEYTLSTDNVTEGATNLYFTNARARGAVSASTGLSYNSGTGAFSVASAGVYGAPTGTVSRTSFASYTAGTTLTFSAGYVQAELTAAATRIAAVEASLQAVSRTLAALITDLRANGNLT